MLGNYKDNLIFKFINYFYLFFSNFINYLKSSEIEPTKKNYNNVESIEIEPTKKYDSNTFFSTDFYSNLHIFIKQYFIFLIFVFFIIYLDFRVLNPIFNSVSNFSKRLASIDSSPDNKIIYISLIQNPETLFMLSSSAFSRGEYDKAEVFINTAMGVLLINKISNEDVKKYMILKDEILKSKITKP
jgi:hypothetical protein